MGTVLARVSFPFACLATFAAWAAEPASRHQFNIELGLGHSQTTSTYGAWPDGGAGKLRYSADGSSGGRLVARYQGRITNTLWTRVALDYDGRDSGTVGLTEAELSWRPVPRSQIRHRARFGAIYPPFSLENTDMAWTSPFGISYSAINSWLAEEVRPIGAEWRMARRLGDSGSPHEVSAFAAAFYGNDPAGTLLFWRGFGIHDRQTRLNERVALPSMPIRDATGSVIGAAMRQYDPIAETDGEPGVYGGLEWKMGRRASVQLAHYDNRADPESFRDGQWGWGTRFWHAAAQVALPGKVGLMAQWMDGDTEWLTFTTPTGQRTADTEFVIDSFGSHFLTLTKSFRERHRISLRRDSFGMNRGSGLTIDTGDASSLSYRYESPDRISVVAEYVRVESTRDIWSFVYGLPRRAVERQFQVRIAIDFAHSQ
jgi:hypothetical protein